MPRLFSSPIVVFVAGILLRVGLLAYGDWQDKTSSLKFTDIDYFVFTDAARYVSRGRSPYDRDTYRYTPLLAWLLLPTARPGQWWFAFGKILFAASDVVAGWIIFSLLHIDYRMSTERALTFASLWLLNPMVASISTRGSSEGLLLVMVMALLWAVLRRRLRLAGCLLGLVVHFKIYPFIYAVSILWWLDSAARSSRNYRFLNADRVNLVLFSALSFALLNTTMVYLSVAAYIIPV